MSEINKKFFKAALTRAAHTAAQTAIASIGTNAVFLSDVSWVAVLSATAMATLVSILKSVIIGMPEAPEDGEGDVH